MADHDKPTVTSNYLDFVNEMHGRMDDLAVGLDPERTSATNVPNYSIRWSSVAKKWQYLDGSTWKDLTSEYAINIAGHAEKLKTPRTIQITGGGSSDAVAFDGTKNIEIPLNSLDLDNLTGLGSAAGVDVVQSTGSSEDDVMSQKAVTDALGNLGLGTAAERDVGTSEGNVMEVGAFGLGKSIRIDDVDLKSKAWWDSLPEGLSYLLSVGHTNGPISNALHLIITKENNDHGRILAQRHTNTSGNTWTLGMSAGNFGEWDAVLSENNFPPIGFCYTQYPGTDTPSTLFGGTWTLMFNTEGVFFRTEGQGASSFGGGVQGDAIRNITGTVGAVSRYTSAAGAFWLNDTSDNWPRGSGYPMSRSRFDASRVVPTAAENRPRNRTIRVWRKTAH